eukprot:TRINITY_DN82112_c0_g1_i1.p1 TRINITY_DN82112_c0_g1~~TRINITY_DN82112_c0_g1_i1.p1  ORF type:complete len:810 (+),score=138.35 TRINITY_DN82112_c0_g1_i1:86-2515(+)
MFWFCNVDKVSGYVKESPCCCNGSSENCYIQPRQSYLGHTQSDVMGMENFISRHQIEHFKSRLRSIKIFETMNEYEIEECAECLEVKAYKEGTEIITQGEVGLDCFIVDAGECYAQVQTPEGGCIEVKEYGPGGFFGERALLRAEPRAATVVARTDCSLLRMCRDRFVKMVESRDKKEGLLRQCKLFETMTDEQIAMLGGVVKLHSFQKGQKIVQQGEEGENFYLIVKGECVATIKMADGEQEVKRYKEGDLFGEKALLEKAPRSATISANADVDVYCISCYDFEMKLGPLSQLKAEQYLADPRKLISDFYRRGDKRGPRGVLDNKALKADERRATDWFAVYRPCSRDSIAKMLGKVGVGKGLNVKGKSSKKNRLSGFVPFIQISDNNHKSEVEESPPDARVEMYYTTIDARESAFAALSKVLEEEPVRKRITAPEINLIDTYLPDCYGLEMPEHLMREVYIMRSDLSPMVGWETGRNSEPAFMDMNLHSTRGASEPRVVVYQYDQADPMNPLGLLVAYAEASVKPVVSDFDTFTVGSKGMFYERLHPEQVELVKWSLKHTEAVLQSTNSVWTSCWLQVLKEEAARGFHPTIPKFGFGDPTSVNLISEVIDVLQPCGAVRHGAECFNFYFPQELDDEFTTVWDGFQDPPWRQLSRDELAKFLLERVKDGYTFPMNPVWAVRDQGWYAIFEALRNSPSARQSFQAWYTDEVIAKIDELHLKFPKGFAADSHIPRVWTSAQTNVNDANAMEIADLAANEVRRIVRSRYKRVRNIIVMVARMHIIMRNHRGYPKPPPPFWAVEPGRSARYLP